MIPPVFPNVSGSTPKDDMVAFGAYKKDNFLFNRFQEVTSECPGIRGHTHNL